MKVAIVNDVHVGNALEHEGIVRASSHLIEDKFERFLEQIVHQHAPDLLINLGDLIRSSEREIDFKKYQQLIEIFEKVKAPTIHLVGNHELKKISLDEIESVWQNHGFVQKSFGSKDFDPFTLIWLGLEVDAKDYRTRSLPLAQLEWLKEELHKKQRPVLIFTHCTIDDQDVTGNFFYEGPDSDCSHT